ncbi:MAG TPA: MmoB/DmpM family protein [Kofleriaceae bacterium]
MSEKMVFLALQDTEDARPIREAIEADNPLAVVSQFPGVYKIDAPGRIVVNRESVEQRLGRPWNPQDIHLTLVSLSGNIDETDDYFALVRT